MPRYRFDAPAGHTLLVGDDVYGPGAEVELPAGQTDPRLTLVDEAGEEDNRSLSDVVQAEADSIDEAEAEADGPLEPSEPETAAQTEDPPAGFGNPRPARGKGGK